MDTSDIKVKIARGKKPGNCPENCRELSRELLRTALAETGITSYTLAHKPSGQPFLKEYPDIFISISHCAAAAAVAVSGKPVGIDIEPANRRAVSERVMRRVLTKEELLYPERFLEFWVKKEAYSKMTGQGLQAGFNTINTIDHKQIRFYEQDGLFVAVAAQPPEHIMDNEQNRSQLHRSGEDYLETILLLHRKTGHVHAVDIAGELGFSKPSVSKALGLLRDGGFVLVSPEGHITLTETGGIYAAAVYKRHTMLRRLFRDVLGVSPETAEADACNAEHLISAETFERLEVFLRERGEQ